MYVTLEPCTHWGQNPPCVDLIIKAGIRKVVYAIPDPNPLVKKRDAKKILEEKGIEVFSGLLAREAEKLNEVYLKNIIHKRPFVTLKAAATLDGKIALESGKSKYLTSQRALADVHLLRSKVDAVLVGINTVLHDDPKLNIRHRKKQNQSRELQKVILDTNLKIPLNARLFENNIQKPIIITSKESLKKKKYQGISKVAEIVTVSEKNKQLDWEEVLKILFARYNVYHLLIEGGQAVFTSALEEKIVDKIVLYYAPKIMLGKNSLSIFAGKDPKALESITNLSDLKIKKLGLDFRVSGYPNKGE
ncbi:bifunctional diaminohydroxyphosphoribosylaminopyrimidine deaminase/5-amino-6-(5-phosphoribosylamino)uracil reductase RibD [Candidatus Margulisiibacteriota bacterium]